MSNSTASKTIRQKDVVPSVSERRRRRVSGVAKSGLGGFLLGRLGHMVVVVFAATGIVFLLMQVLGDPVAAMLPLGTSQEQIDAVRATLGLNDPVPSQYWHFISGAVHGDFGTSLWLGTSAMDAAFGTVPKTFFLVIPACVLGVIAGSGLGLLAGASPGSRVDSAITSIAYLLISVAEFWIALILIYVFAARLQVAATGGYALDFKHLVLPVIVLAMRPLAHSIQIMRASVIQEMRQPYVMTARSRGATERRILVRHVLPNAGLSVLSVAFYDLSRMFVAGTVVEVVFAWPGLGRMSVDALSHGDIPLIEATVVLAAIIVCVLNIIGDLVMYKLDPRTRSSFRRPTA